MRILVPVKRVLDANITPRVRGDGAGVALDGLKMSINPFCEIAVEAAVRMKEAGLIEDVLVVSVGPEACREVVRTALAMGADRGLVVVSDISLEPLAVAKCLHEIARREQTDLIVMGKQAIDDDAGQTGQMLAALLDWPQATQASSICLNPSARMATVTRETDDGTETLELDLPAVITADLRLNEPRYASLPAVIKAKKKNIDIVAAETFGLDLTKRMDVLAWMEPTQRRSGKMVFSVHELLELLKHEARVI